MELDIQYGKRMFRVVETFSGIGAQAKALERIGIEHEIVHTCEWDINAIIAYYKIHKGGINTQKYSGITDEEIEQYLRKLTLSMDGKKPLNQKSLKSYSKEFRRLLYSAISETNNLVSITDVHGCNIQENIDLFTYSFPCQDLSLCGCWHGNKSGISRDVHNRSGMLWEVERILKEMHSAQRKLPHFLIMENVTNILSKTHEDDFNDWKSTLIDLGYYNKIYRLNSKNFGIPQKRERAYMVSILCEGDLDKIMKLNEYYIPNGLNDLENISIAEHKRRRKFMLKDVLKLNYSNKNYEEEAKFSQPNDTMSRRKIWEENDILFDGMSINEMFINTVTTKQDRNPNSGLISYDSGREGKSTWRYLTPRECFLLMGFDESDYVKVIEGNPIFRGEKQLLTKDKLLKMAGNSICVDVLEVLFKQIIEINKFLFID